MAYESNFYFPPSLILITDLLTDSLTEECLAQVAARLFGWLGKNR